MTTRNVSIRMPHELCALVSDRALQERMSFHAMTLRLLERGAQVPRVLEGLILLNPAEREGVLLAIRELEEAEEQIRIRSRQVR